MKEYKGLIVFIILACVLTMTIGFAALSQRLDINGTSSISSVWDVKITNITSKATGGASDQTPPEYTDTTAKFDAALVNPGDTMTYDITVTNAGTLDAILEKINMTTSNNTAIEFSYSGVTEGDILKAETSTNLQVVVKYLENVTTQPGEVTSDLIVTLDYKQATTSGGDDTPIVVKPNLNFSVINEGVTIAKADEDNLTLGGNLSIPENTISEVKVIIETPYEYRCIDDNNCHVQATVTGDFSGELLYIGANEGTNAKALYELQLTGITGPGQTAEVKLELGSESNIVNYTINTNLTVTELAYTDAAAFTFDASTGTIEVYDESYGLVVVIPETINGVKVTTIGNMAFAMCNITQVHIPSTVTFIDTYAFASTDINTVILPESIESLGDSVFGNGSVKNVYVPGTLKNTGDGTFTLNGNLERVIISRGVTTIGQGVFGAGKLKDVVIPSTVTTIANSAFYNSNFTEVTIPSSVTSIGASAFSKNNNSSTNLTKIINKTGRAFDWGSIINNESGYNFVTGTVENAVSNVEITAE